MKRKLQEKEYVPIDVYYRNHVTMNNRIYNGWKFIHKTSIIKIFTGLSLIAVGVVTLPIPTGSIPMIIVGLGLVSAGGIDIFALKRTIYWEVITRLKMRKNR